MIFDESCPPGYLRLNAAEMGRAVTQAVMALKAVKKARDGKPGPVPGTPGDESSSSSSSSESSPSFESSSSSSSSESESEAANKGGLTGGKKKKDTKAGKTRGKVTKGKKLGGGGTKPAGPGPLPPKKALAGLLGALAKFTPSKTTGSKCSHKGKVCTTSCECSCSECVAMWSEDSSESSSESEAEMSGLERIDTKMGITTEQRARGRARDALDAEIVRDDARGLASLRALGVDGETAKMARRAFGHSFSEQAAALRGTSPKVEAEPERNGWDFGAPDQKITPPRGAAALSLPEPLRR